MGDGKNKNFRIPNFVDHRVGETPQQGPSNVSSRRCFRDHAMKPGVALDLGKGLSQGVKKGVSQSRSSLLIPVRSFSCFLLRFGKQAERHATGPRGKD